MNKKSNIFKPKLCASVICIKKPNINKDLSILEDENFDYLHYDIMDGFFVPRTGLDLNTLEQISKNISIPINAHLMVEDPNKYVDKIVEAGASVITFHIETMKKNIIKNISKYSNIKIGLALKPLTPIETIYPYLNFVDIITLMAYPP